MIVTCIGQKLGERLILPQNEKTIAQCLKLELEEGVTLSIALAEKGGRMSIQFMVLEMKQRTVGDQIRQKLDEKVAFQLRQRRLDKAPRRKWRERLAINRLQLAEVIKGTLEGRVAHTTELQIFTEVIGQKREERVALETEQGIDSFEWLD